MIKCRLATDDWRSRIVASQLVTSRLKMSQNFASTTVHRLMKFSWTARGLDPPRIHDMKVESSLGGQNAVRMCCRSCWTNFFLDLTDCWSFFASSCNLYSFTDVAPTVSTNILFCSFAIRSFAAFSVRLTSVFDL